MKIISELYAIGVFFQGILSISSLKAWQSLGPPIRTSAIRTRLVISLYHLSTTSPTALKQVYFDPALIRTEQIDAYYNRLRTKNALGALTSLARSLSTLPSEQYASRIAEIQVDTLIIWGRDDAWIPQEDAFKFKQALPKARLEVILFCGHIPQEENPEETARLIMEFVANK